MGSMIERVARAIFDSLYGDTHTGGWDFGTGDVSLSEEQKTRFRKMARAAIRAMLEPTPEMLAPEDVHWDYRCHMCGGAKETYTLMLTVALNEETQGG